MSYETEAVWSAAQQVLDGVVSFFAQQEVELPARRYIAVGETAHDCEQVTVSFVQAYGGTPGDQAQQPILCNNPRSAVFTVQVVRKVPGIHGGARGGRVPAPDPTEMNTASRIKLIDAWLLVCPELQQVIDPTNLGILTDVTVTDPQGEFQAVQANVVMQVP